MIKSCSGIVAALAFLCCCSQAEADGGNFQGKLMADRPGSQGPEWVLYEELPEDGEIVSFNQAGHRVCLIFVLIIRHKHI